MATAPVPEEKKISLRFWVDTEQNKVIFAVADCEFVDVLLSFMTLPLGTILRVLNKKQFGEESGVTMGSLNNLRDSLGNLSSSEFSTEQARLMLLNPKNASEAECQQLKLNVDDSPPTKYYRCPIWEFCALKNRSYVCVSPQVTARCGCGTPMSKELAYSTWKQGGGVFTCETLSFIISDDLRVMPNLAGLTIELLKGYGVQNMDLLEEKVFDFGLKEIWHLLKLSLHSSTPLTDLVLQSPQTSIDMIKQEQVCFSNTQKADGTKDSKQMVVKILMQKSTKKLLFAETGEDFVDFLFSLLPIPLGSVVSLLGGNSNLGSIDKLYKSISTLSTDRYLKSENTQRLLLKPKLPPHYLCKNQLLPLNEKPSDPDLVMCTVTGTLYPSSPSTPSTPITGLDSRASYKTVTWLTSELRNDPKGGEGFIRGPAMFMVTDDLVVTPLSSISIISFLNTRIIPLWDVEELVLNIGTQEAQGILKASLTSSSALTDGLKLSSLQQPKQEK